MKVADFVVLALGIALLCAGPALTWHYRSPPGLGADWTVYLCLSIVTIGLAVWRLIAARRAFRLISLFPIVICAWTFVQLKTWRDVDSDSRYNHSVKADWEYFHYYVVGR